MFQSSECGSSKVPFGLKRNGVWELMKSTFRHSDDMKCSTLTVRTLIVSRTLFLQLVSLLTSAVILHSRLLTVFSCCIYGANRISTAVTQAFFLSHVFILPVKHISQYLREICPDMVMKQAIAYKLYLRAPVRKVL
jgi:hypothetical protein